MNTTEIGQYRIVETNNSIQIIYKRSIKNWVSISIFFSLGLFALITSVNLFIREATKASSYLNAVVIFDLFICFLFGLFSIIAFYYVLKRLYETRHTIAEVDRNLKLLKFKTFLNKRIHVKLEDIKCFNLYGSHEIIKGTEGSSGWTYCDLILSTHNNENYKVQRFDIETLLKGYDSTFENKDVYYIAKKVAKIIAEGCDSSYNWHRRKK